MRRSGILIALFVLLGAIACQPPPSSPPAPTAKPIALSQPARPVAATPTAETWGETNLPASSAPGASSDDTPAQRAKAQAANNPNAPHVPPIVTPAPLRAGLSQDVVVDGLQLPVAFEFTPDGRQIFINELYGKVRLFDNGKLRPNPVVTLPTTQGLEQGALGLALDPNFTQTHWFYVLYSQTVAGKNEPRRNRVVRFTEHDGQGVDETIILDNLPIGKPSPENLNGDHNGGRIGFGPDGKLYIAMGDTARRTQAKSLRNPHGKLLRVNPDGSIPDDNPDPEQAVFASGLRSPFGLDFQPGTGLPWVTDNGPQGHDEIDRLVKGGNFGWPDVAGRASGKGKSIDPVWESGIERYGPTGLAFYTGTAVPEWQNDLFFCDWNTGSLRRLQLQAPTYDTAGQVEIVAQPCRLNVRNGPDGALYFSDHHAIYRLGPAR